MQGWMRPLPVNPVLPRLLRARYYLALGALPIGLVLGAVFLLPWFATWLATRLGIPAHAPVKDHPNGPAWMAAFFGGMLAGMAAGYALGWILNAMIARVVLGWSGRQLRAVFWEAEVPEHWWKPGVKRNSAVGPPPPLT